MVTARYGCVPGERVDCQLQSLPPGRQGESGLVRGPPLAEHLVLHKLILALVGFGLIFRLLETYGGCPVQQSPTNVGGHDDDGVTEIDCAPLGVGQLAVLQDLKQHSEYAPHQ